MKMIIVKNNTIENANFNIPLLIFMIFEFLQVKKLWFNRFAKSAVKITDFKPREFSALFLIFADI